MMPDWILQHFTAISGVSTALLGLGVGFAWGQRHERLRGILAYAPDSDFVPDHPAVRANLAEPLGKRAIAVPSTATVVAVASNVEQTPSQWLLTNTANEPLMKVQSVDPTRYAGRTRSAPLPRSGSISRLSALLQAAPAVLASAGQTSSGTSLMRVEISGALTRAADGNGLRAFSVGSDGRITEHARLFQGSSGQAQSLVHAAAAFQVISVLVAQKHLADISAKLSQIQSGIDRVQQFLENQRCASIAGTFEYLKQAHETLSRGELAQAVRAELESCDRELLQTHKHLMADFRQSASQVISSTEMAGTEELAKAATRKSQRLDELAQAAAACARTRGLAWHVLSLFPGEPGLKASRLQQLKGMLEDLASLDASVAEALEQDVQQFKSFWNRKDTLAERQHAARQAFGAVQAAIKVHGQQLQQSLQSSVELLSKTDRTAQYLFEVRDGQIAGILLPA